MGVRALIRAQSGVKLLSRLRGKLFGYRHRLLDQLWYPQLERRVPLAVPTCVHVNPHADRHIDGTFSSGIAEVCVFLSLTLK